MRALLLHSTVQPPKLQVVSKLSGTNKVEKICRWTAPATVTWHVDLLLKTEILHGDVRVYVRQKGEGWDNLLFITTNETRWRHWEKRADMLEITLSFWSDSTGTISPLAERITWTP